MDIHAYISSGIIESYVMGLCTAEEEKEFEQLRRQYPELEEAIVIFEEQMEKKFMQQSIMPEHETDHKILGKLFELNKKGTIVVMQSKRRAWLKPLAVAASILLLFSTGLNYYLYKKIGEKPQSVNMASLPLQDYEVMNNPSITPVAMYGVGYHAICRCTMFWDKKTGKIYLMIHHLQKSPPQKDYQLWATVNGKPVSIGIVQDEIRGRFIELSNVPAGATAFAVTLEKDGGSETPDIAEMYLKGSI